MPLVMFVINALCCSMIIFSSRMSTASAMIIIVFYLSKISLFPQKYYFYMRNKEMMDINNIKILYVLLFLRNFFIRCFLL